MKRQMDKNMEQWKLRVLGGTLGYEGFKDIMPVAVSSEQALRRNMLLPN